MVSGFMNRGSTLKILTYFFLNIAVLAYVNSNANSAWGAEPNECKVPWQPGLGLVGLEDGIDLHEVFGLSEKTFLAVHHCADGIDPNTGLVFVNIPIKSKFVVELTTFAWLPENSEKGEEYRSRLKDMVMTTVVDLDCSLPGCNNTTAFSCAFDMNADCLSGQKNTYSSRASHLVNERLTNFNQVFEGSDACSILALDGSGQCEFVESIPEECNFAFGLSSDPAVAEGCIGSAVNLQQLPALVLTDTSPKASKKELGETHQYDVFITLKSGEPIFSDNLLIPDLFPGIPTKSLSGEEPLLIKFVAE